MSDKCHYCGKDRIYCETDCNATSRALIDINESLVQIRKSFDDSILAYQNVMTALMQFAYQIEQRKK